MPLHIHTSTGERVHAVPGSREDQRLTADPAWHLDAAPPDEQPDTSAGPDLPEESP